MCGKKNGAVSGDHFTGHIAQKLSLGLAYYVCVLAIFVHWLSLLLSILFFPNIQVQSKLLFGMLHEALLIYYT